MVWCHHIAGGGWRRVRQLAVGFQVQVHFRRQGETDAESFFNEKTSRWVRVLLRLNITIASFCIILLMWPRRVYGASTTCWNVSELRGVYWNAVVITYVRLIIPEFLCK